MTPNDPRSRPRCGITVGVDGSDESRSALRWAAAEAQARAVPLRAVLAWTARIPIAAHGAQPFGAAASDEDARRALHRTVVEEVGAAAAAAVELVTVCAPASRALLDAAAGSELLVLGTAPRTAGSRRGLGSVARHVLDRSPCPVVVAR